MVQTRSAHGVDVPPTPARTTRASSAALASAHKPSTTRSRKSTPAVLDPTPESATAVVPVSAPAAAPASTPAGFSYTPDVLTLVWLAVSIPLVFWDLGYILLRPYTLPGGPLGWLYVPYQLYSKVDLVYSTESWKDGEGFGQAQSMLNLIENVLYLAFFKLWAQHGLAVGGAKVKTVSGRPAALAVVLLFAAAVMTESKTILYWFNEYYSHFGNIGHNDLYSLIFLWIIPNGLWLVFPAYVSYRAASAIIGGLAGSAVVVKEE